METLLNRYTSLTVLLIVVLAQLVGVAYQVRTNSDERLIRVWAVTAVTPMTGIVEAIRHNTIGFLQDYFILLDVREQNRKLKTANDKLRMENIYFRNQLATAEHAQALLLFQAKTPSKTVAARVIGNSTVDTAKAVFIDRGSTSGIERGMAVVTPEGIVGKVTAAYPLVAQVLLITDPTFNVGVESQRGHVHGVLNCGTGKCSVEQIQNEDRVDAGEWFFTSGEDRIFPRGFPVGIVVSAVAGQNGKEVKLDLSGSPGAADEVLVVLQGVHQSIPKGAPVQAAADILPAPPVDPADSPAAAVRVQTEADRVLQKYDAIGKAQNHVYGAYGSAMPDFNADAGAKKAALHPPTGQPSAQSQGQKRGPTIATGTAPAMGAPPASVPAKPGSPVGGILGGRGSSLPAAVTVPAAPPAAPPATQQTSTGPPLLGAPRHSSTQTTTSAPQKTATGH